MDKLRRDEGRTTTEYLGLLVVVTLIVATLAASGLKAVTAAQVCTLSAGRRQRHRRRSGGPFPAKMGPRSM